MRQAQQFDWLSNGVPAASMLVFAAAWYFGDIFIATAVLIATLGAHLLAMKLFRRRIEKMTVITFLLVLVMGGLTLLLRDKAFIQLKTSVVYTLFGLALLVADFAFKKNLPKLLLSHVVAAADAVWRRLSSALAAFFLAIAACNYYIATHFSEATWVGVKTFGFPAATLVFMLALAGYLFRAGTFADADIESPER